jgi:hypothetical protein
MKRSRPIDCATMRLRYAIALLALRDIASGRRPELDDWGDYLPSNIAKRALMRMRDARRNP